MTNYNHAEAFCLMWYACDQCGHRERVWNSRDGVTPFGVLCPSCGGPHLTHIDWGRDICAPNHQLIRGQRFFRDGTSAEAVRIVRRRIARLAGTEYAVPPEVAEALIAEASETTGDWKHGWPYLDRKPDHDQDIH